MKSSSCKSYSIKAHNNTASLKVSLLIYKCLYSNRILQDFEYYDICHC